MNTKPLRTAAELYGYCRAHDLGSGNTQGWDLKHFGLIAESLAPDEQVLTAFEGLHNFRSVSKHDNNFAYAITNKRFILAQKKVIGSVFQTISLKNINDVTFQKKLAFGIITIDTIKETFNIASNVANAQKIHEAIHEALEYAGSSGSSANISDSSSFSAQLVELKKLLDAGIITQRDFEAKKRKILGI